MNSSWLACGRVCNNWPGRVQLLHFEIQGVELLGGEVTGPRHPQFEKGLSCFFIHLLHWFTRGKSIYGQHGEAGWTTVVLQSAIELAHILEKSSILPESTSFSPTNPFLSFGAMLSPSLEILQKKNSREGVVTFLQSN